MAISLADLRETVRDYQAEITELEMAHYKWLDFNPVRAAMVQAFAEAGIGFSMQYAEESHFEERLEASSPRWP